jgi:hypothetical protein
MSQWTDRINQHAIFIELEGLDDLLIATRERAHENADALDAWDRIQHIATRSRHLLGRIDPMLVHPPFLDNMANCLRKVRNELDSYLANGNVGHLSNANAHLDNCFTTHLGQLPVIVDQPDVEDLREAASNYRRSIGQLARNLESEIGEISQIAITTKARLEEFNHEIGNQKQRLDNSISAFQQQFSNAEENRRAEFTQAERDRSVEFDSGQAKRDEDYESEKETMGSLFLEIADAAKDTFNALNVDTKATVAGLIEAIEKQKTKADDLVGIIAMTGMAGGFQRVANEERRAATFWRRIAVGAMVGLIIFAMVTFGLTFSENFNPGHFTSRLLVTITFAFLAGYAAMQAQRHLQAERENRRLELDIASIDPFLATLPDESQHEVKKQLAEKLFGKSDALEIKHDQEVGAKSLIDLLKLTLENLTKK